MDDFLYIFGIEILDPTTIVVHCFYLERDRERERESMCTASRVLYIM